MQQPVKLYDPLEPVTIALTREEWNTIVYSLEFDADYHKAQRVQILGNIKDPEIRAKWAAEHERDAETSERLIKTIEAVLIPPTTTPEE